MHPQGARWLPFQISSGDTLFLSRLIWQDKAGQSQLEGLPGLLCCEHEWASGTTCNLRGRVVSRHDNRFATRQYYSTSWTPKSGENLSWNSNQRLQGRKLVSGEWGYVGTFHQRSSLLLMMSCWFSPHGHWLSSRSLLKQTWPQRGHSVNITGRPAGRGHWPWDGALQCPKASRGPLWDS